MKVIVTAIKDFLRQCRPLKKLPQHPGTEMERVLKIEARHCRFMITGTDLDNFIVIRFRHVTVIDPGVCYVDRRKFLEVMKEMKEGTMEMSISQGRLYFGPSYMVAEKGIEYPKIHDETLIPYAALNMRDVKKVYYAAGRQDSRYTLNAVCVDLTKSRLIATDGHRIAILDIGTHAPRKIIIHRKTVDLMLSLGVQSFLLCANEKGNILVLKSTNVTMRCWPVEGNYPNCSQFLQMQHDNKLICDRQRLKKAISRAACINTKDVNVYFRNGNAVVASQNADGDSFREEIPCSYSCDPVAGFCSSPSYMLEALNNIYLRSVRIEFEGLEPILLKDINGTLHAVVMPRRSTLSCGYDPDPEDAVFVETVRYIDDRLRDIFLKRREERKKRKSIRREIKRLLSSPLGNYTPGDLTYDDVYLKYRDIVLYNSCINIMQIVYPGWRDYVSRGLFHANKLKPLPDESILRERISEIYRLNVEKEINFWGTRGRLGDILTEKQFRQAVTNRGRQFIEMIEEARKKKQCVRVAFIKKG